MADDGFLAGDRSFQGAWNDVFTPHALNLDGHDIKNARDAQEGAMREANALQGHMYEQNRTDNAPWRAAGIQGLSQITGNLNDYTKDFSASDFQQDPGYQFRLSEGQKALERAAGAKGGMDSGATMKSLSNYNQGMASQEYQGAYDRFNTNRTQRFNRLASLSGIGQTAQGQTNTAGQNYGNQVSTNLINQGNNNAEAITAQGNMRRNYANNLMSFMAL